MITFDPDALYVALDRRRRHERLLWRDIADQAGVSPSTLTRLGHGASPDARGLVRLMAWLGESDIRPFTREVS